MTNVLNKKSPYILYIASWFFVNLLTLINFPIMHSDEAWLVGLTKSMVLEKQLLTTELFFDSAPRAPHTLKVLFHLLQMPLIALFGYDLFSVRLLSLIFGALTVLLIIILLKSTDTTLLITLLSSIYITTINQFIYASHFARQEILITAILVSCYALYTNTSFSPDKKALVSGLLIGTAITLHPNAFFLAVMIGLVYLMDLVERKASVKTLLMLILPMGLSAFANIAITFNASKDFLKNYWRYASELEIGADPVSRFENFKSFYLKLYQGISGTYFLTDLRGLFLMAIAILITVALAVTLGYQRKTLLTSPILKLTVSSIVGYNIALFIIGRYNQTSIIFLVIPTALLIIESIRLLLSKRILPFVLGLMILFNLNLSYADIQNSHWNDYDVYMDFLKTNLSHDDVILGNLSGGFAMSPDRFFDIRNLAYMDTDIRTYLKDNQINTIVWYEEYDYIHRNPNWQILYGDDSGYYDDIKKILADHSTLRAETTSIHYGNRIIRYQDGYPWKIWIYELDDI